MRKTPLPEEYTREYYLNACEGFREFQMGKLSPRHRIVLKYLNVKPVERVLDIGCGRGELVRESERLGAYAVGIDYSPAAIKLSRDSGATIAANATYLPFTDETFDKVALIDVVEHLDQHDFNACLMEISRVLKTGGILLIETPNRLRRLIRWWDRLVFQPQLLTLLSPELPYYLRTMHVNEQSPFSLRRTLSQNGFRCKIRFWFPEIAGLPFWKTIGYRLFFFCGPMLFLAWQK